MLITPLGTKIIRYLWIILVTGLMLLAVYVSVGRMVMPRLVNYQADIEAALSERLGMTVSAQQLQGSWWGFQPMARLQQITIIPPDPDASAVITIQKIEMQLDVIASLLSTKPIFSSLMLQGIHVELEQSETGKWHMKGTPKGDGSSNPVAWLLLQERLLLKQVTLTLHPYEASTRELQIPEWSLICGLTVCSSEARLLLQADAQGVLELGMNVYGHPDNKDFRLEGYLKTEPLQLMEWLPLVRAMPRELTSVKGLLLGGEVWFEWDNKQLTDVRGRIDVPEIQLGSEHETLAAIDFLHSNFTWKRDTGNKQELWALWLNDLTFKWADQVFEPAQRRLSLIQQEQSRVVKLVADRVELLPIANTLLALKSLPDELRYTLAELNPSGQLHNLFFEYPLDSTAEYVPFKVRATLHNVAVAPWRNAPTLVGVSGYLEAGPLGGMVDFESSNLVLHFPEIFTDNWLFKKARGVVSWEKEADEFWLRGEDLKLNGALGDVSGRFRAVLSKEELEPRLSLLIGLQNSRLPDAMTFVPDKVINPEVGDWLAQAFSQGHVKQARFVLDQALEKGAAEITRTLAMSIDADKVDFSYHPDWPQLTQADVKVCINDTQVDVVADSARFYDIALQDIEANYLVSRGKSRLKAKANLQGSLKDAWLTVTDTPLQKNIFALADDFQFKGLMKGQLSLDLPFSSLDKSQVELAFETHDAALDIPSLNVSVGAIEGAFSYSTLAGLVAPGVKARMFGYPLALNISSQEHASGMATRIDALGHLKVASLAPWAPSVVLDHADGETDYNVQLNIGRGSKNQLQVDSDLKGIAVTLPAPFTKQSLQSSRFSINLSLDEPQIHSLQYADKFGYSLRFANQGYQDGVISIGAETARYQPSSGIQVKGKLPELDVGQWQQWLGQNKVLGRGATGSNGSNPQASLLSKINDVQLNVGRFKFLDSEYEKVEFAAKQQQGDWQIGFVNSLAKGVLEYSPLPTKPLAVDFDYLYLQGEEGGVPDTKTKIKVDTLTNRVPQKFPVMDLRVKKLYLGDKPFGRWAFNSRPNDKGVRFEKLDFEFDGMQGRGEMDWLYIKGVHSSEFRGELIIPDVAEMLRVWKMSAAIEGKDARFSGQLNWPGAPNQFSVLSMQGPLSMKVKQGRVVDLQALPLLGVLNFNALSRRLRLDFSDIFKKGFSFDEAEGAFQFERGKMLFTQALIIDGPSAKFKVEGETDLRNEQFANDVLVVLPVNDNISVIATLAGFPQVGIPMYLLNRALDGLFDRFTSIHYRVTGSWSEPDIELTSFFDTKDLIEDDKTTVKGRPKR